MLETINNKMVNILNNSIRIIVNFPELITSLKSNIAINGSYFTTNIGDLSIGQTIQSELEKMKIESILLSRFLLTPKHYDIIIIGGGGVIHDKYNHNINLRISPIRKSKSSLYIGIGVPGFQTDIGKKIVIEIEKANYITVRDDLSKKRLGKLISSKIEVNSCPSWLFDENIENIKELYYRNKILYNYYNKKYLRNNYSYLYIKELIAKSKLSKIGISLKPFPKFNKKNIPHHYKKIRDFDEYEKKYLYWIKKEIDKLSLRNKLFFIPFSNYDLIFYSKFLNNCNIEILPLQSPKNTFNTIKLLDKMVVMPYHAHIFSILAGKPFFSINYSEKISSITKHFNNLKQVDITNPKSYKEIMFNTNIKDMKIIKKNLKKEAKKNIQIIYKNIRQFYGN